jgi:DNA-binding response OmpR family regulator
LGFGLERNLRFEGYEVLLAADGEAALQAALNRRFDLLILDIMLPKVNGYEVCKTIRREGIDTPVIFLSAKSQETDKVLGLELGGDDYLTKPFGLRELMARVKSILRRSEAQTPKVLECGPLRIDLSGRNVSRNGRSLEMTSKEFELLRYLVEKRGRVLSRDEILSRVWGFDYDGTARTIDNFINRLRQKIGDDVRQPRLILTVRGVGYKFATN